MPTYTSNDIIGLSETVTSSAAIDLYNEYRYNLSTQSERELIQIREDLSRYYLHVKPG